MRTHSPIAGHFGDVFSPLRGAQLCRGLRIGRESAGFNPHRHRSGMSGPTGVWSALAPSAQAELQTMDELEGARGRPWS
jgi:hypothetical protein